MQWMVWSYPGSSDCAAVPASMCVKPSGSGCAQLMMLLAWWRRGAVPLPPPLLLRVPMTQWRRRSRQRIQLKRPRRWRLAQRQPLSLRPHSTRNRRAGQIRLSSCQSLSTLAHSAHHRPDSPTHPVTSLHAPSTTPLSATTRILLSAHRCHPPRARLPSPLCCSQLCRTRSARCRRCSTWTPLRWVVV